jgi:AAA15 family ATPase/GTPase
MTMSIEKLSITNFGGISELELELAQINVLIGPQASGKSICAKLCYFFKEIISDLTSDIADGETKIEIKQGDEDTFLKYFPPSSWGQDVFDIRYSCGQVWINVKRTTNYSSRVSISYSRYLGALIKSGVEAIKSSESIDQSIPQKDFEDFRLKYNRVYAVVDQRLDKEISPALTNRNTFIPAGRSFFATIQKSVFSVIARNGAIDPFLLEFGSSYEYQPQQLREERGGKPSNESIERHIVNLIGGTYLHIKGDDFIQMIDGRRIPIETASSGQQEALPLAITLAGIVHSRQYPYCTLIIEEPEAHLYPTAQREIVHLIALVAGLVSERQGSQYFITTHSPYILAALNNLMYAGKISKEKPEKNSQLTKILGGVFVDPSCVHAYALGGGTAYSIIDPETGLVNAEVLDKVSGELAQEFEALVDVDFEEQTA